MEKPATVNRQPETVLLQFIDPRSDYAFKRIFGNDKAHDILISFLNAIIGLTGDRRMLSCLHNNFNQYLSERARVWGIDSAVELKGF